MDTKAIRENLKSAFPAFIFKIRDNGKGPYNITLRSGPIDPVWYTAESKAYRAQSIWPGMLQESIWGDRQHERLVFEMMYSHIKATLGARKFIFIIGGLTTPYINTSKGDEDGGE